MSGAKKIRFEIETITPMFLAGADQTRAELRAASIKGLLRFWWRALQSESNLDDLRKKEGRIFGGADEKQGRGSSFSIRQRVIHDGDLKRTTVDLPKHNISVTSISKGRTFPVNILEYLAYGPCSYDRTKKRNVIEREYIQHGFKFTIQMMIFRERFLNELLKVIYVFDLFGGIGSRSRNGFGSFSVVNKKKCFSLISSEVSINNPYTKENLQEIIKPTDSKSYPSFTKETKVFRTKELYNSWDKALADVGKIYRGIRSGDIKSNEGKNNVFERKHTYNKRIFIGSPIIVQKKEKSFLSRHAKPYFIKIVKEDNQYRAYILYLPSQYCYGLEEDRNKKRINYSDVDRRFTEVCNEFNDFLSQHMKTVL
ncbi:MAG: type III-B CRISPR module RAMP protein Cmr1 [Nitrospirota bacterium]